MSSYQDQEEGPGSGGGPEKARAQVFVFDDLAAFASPGPPTSSNSIAPDGDAASTNEGDRRTLLKHIGVARILGVENAEEKGSTNGSLGDRESSGRTILPDALHVVTDKLNHEDTGDCSCSDYFATRYSSSGGWTISRSPLYLKIINFMCSISTPSDLSYLDRNAHHLTCKENFPKPNKNADLGSALDIYRTVFSLWAPGHLSRLWLEQTGNRGGESDVEVEREWKWEKRG